MRLGTLSWQLYGALLLSSACSELVELGNNCPGARCVETDDGGPPLATHDAQPASDAAVDSMQNVPPSDAQQAGTGDSAPPAPPQFPAILNGEFDLTSGSPGDVTTVSLTGIDPWSTCQPIGGGDNATTAVRAETSVTLMDNETPANATVTSPGGSTNTFINMQYLVNIVPVPLAETLGSPLLPGTLYALAVTVQSSKPDALLSLELRGADSGTDCLTVGGEALASTPPITTPGWQTVCLEFTPSSQTSHLVLSLKSSASLQEALMLGGARMFFDSLRPATHAECPALL